MAKISRDGYVTLFEEYVDKTGKTKVSIPDYIEWGMKKGGLSMSERAKFKYHCQEAAKALRNHRVVDRSGRTVRAIISIHVAGQKFFWAQKKDAEWSELVAFHIRNWAASRTDVRSHQAFEAHMNDELRPEGEELILLDWDFVELHDDEQDGDAKLA